MINSKFMFFFPTRMITKKGGFTEISLKTSPPDHILTRLYNKFLKKDESSTILPLSRALEKTVSQKRTAFYYLLETVRYYVGDPHYVQCTVHVVP